MLLCRPHMYHVESQRLPDEQGQVDDNEIVAPGGTEMCDPESVDGLASQHGAPWHRQLLLLSPLLRTQVDQLRWGYARVVLEQNRQYKMGNLK